ncbi:MAG: hypothetical protein QUV06_13075 [Cyanobium sp. CZS 48M]|nr:hypothetical protein [Cyanobium sp. CZS48M]
MTREAFERGDWGSWLRYGAALLQTLEPGQEQGRQQQAAALAFLQAQRQLAAQLLQPLLLVSLFTGRGA